MFERRTATTTQKLYNMAYEVSIPQVMSPVHYVEPSFTGELKVGRSGNAEMRRCALSAQQNFEMVVLFFGLGHLEKRVHSTLADKRSPIATEWFTASLKEVVEAIRTTARDNDKDVDHCLMATPLSSLLTNPN